jgi:transcriptional regulator with XRE-family HTH domain
MIGTLGQRLLLARRDLDITQAALASQARISPQYISDLERGKTDNPSLRDLEALAEALGIPAAYLAGWVDDPSGEGIAEGSFPYTVNPHIQAMLDLYEDLDPANQAIALEIINTLRRSQHVRVVGD